MLQAKNHLSELLRKAELGEDVFIRRGRSGRLFRIVPVADAPARTLAANPKWKGTIAYRDEDIWASEWKDEA